MAADPRSPSRLSLEGSMVSKALEGAMDPDLAKLPGLGISDAERAAMTKLRKKVDGSRYPIEWVVDVADNSLNWFIATAYEYDDATQRLTVAIPDRDDPQWEGELPLDDRMIHLIECCDGDSKALYKWIVASATIPVHWKIEQCGEAEGEWRDGVARWFGQLAHVVYCEAGANFEEVGVDEHLRLSEAVGSGSGSGARDFDRLIRDGIVAWSGHDDDMATAVGLMPTKALRPNLAVLERLAEEMGACMRDALRMRCIAEAEQDVLADLLQKHVLKGDMDSLERMRDTAERGADILRRRAAHVEETEAFVGRCEARFWRAAASGLFFRRRYNVGDDVEVVLCRGLHSAIGKVARLHDNETYDVDLNGSSTSALAGTSSSAEVGIQIPPEYLILREAQTKAVSGGGDSAEQEQVRAKVAALWTEREALKKELDALTQDRDRLEDDCKRMQPPAEKRPRSANNVMPPPAPPQTGSQSATNASADARGTLPDQRGALPDRSEAPLKVWVSTWTAANAAAGLASGLPDRATALGFDVIALSMPSANYDEGALLDRLLGGGSNLMTWRSLVADEATLVLVARKSTVPNESLFDDSVDFFATKRGAGCVFTVGARKATRRKVAFVCGAVDDADKEAFDSDVSMRAAAVADCLQDESRQFQDAARGADHAFFLVDGSFAVDDAMCDVAAALQAQDWPALAAHDAFTRDHAEGRVCAGWETVVPRNKPTLVSSDGTQCGWSERVCWKSLPGFANEIQLDFAEHRARAACASFSLAARLSRAGPASLRLEGLGLSGVSGPPDASYRLELGDKTTTLAPAEGRGVVEWLDEELHHRFQEDEHATISLWTADDVETVLVGSCTITLRQLSSKLDEAVILSGAIVARLHARVHLGDDGDRRSLSDAPEAGKAKKKSVFKAAASMLGSFRKKK
ncbi:hypothetical protein M885DRAFT_521834 [Pelagophyceae sp. CCMP2097]|nr:hypothetical protein M885DRAFT_521834 [Pelagophyceae sp. CCMP2097]